METVRRITGGGALYMDEGQFGMELVFHRATLGIGSLDGLAGAICRAIALGLSTLGVPARWRPRNDVEVDGRKISGTGGFFDGDTLFYQATILADMDSDRMLRALNVPAAKLAKRTLDDAGARVTTLKALLGAAMPGPAVIREALLRGLVEHLGIETVPGAITDREEERARRAFEDEIGTDAFVAEIDGAPEDAWHASVTGKGGTIEAHVRLEGEGAEPRIREVLITGDFFVTPPRTIFDLEAALRGAAISEVRERIESFFAATGVGVLSAGAGDFADAVETAVAGRNPSI